MSAWYVYIPALYTIPLNGEVYGVVYSIYIFGAGSTLLVTAVVIPTTLIGDKWRVRLPRFFFLCVQKRLEKHIRI